MDTLAQREAELLRQGKPFRIDPMPRFSEAATQYHDDRGNRPRCSTWKRDWGRIKDFREARRDSFLVYAQHLQGQIARADQILAGHSAVSPELARHNLADLPFPQSLDAARRITFREKTYSYCLFHPKKADIRLTGRVPSGFAALHQLALQQQKTLVLAMNAGIYQPDKQPVGLMIVAGEEVSPLNQQQGRGNFYMQPNGVFGVLQDGRAFVVSTASFAKGRDRLPPIKLATQSGPMLLRGGEINSAFTPGSDNLHFRNAVGVIKGTRQVVFVISEQKVCFYDLAAFLQDLGCDYALYLDGTISRMYLPALNKTQDLTDSRHLGPVLYLME